jgi:mannose-1-phosphate guanylyltransferase
MSEGSVQAVILAGGLGTRLWPLTREIPKPMIPVGGVPYLEHQLRLLGSQRIRDIVILAGYLGDRIEEYFGDGSRLDLRIRYSREQTPLGTGGALRLAEPLLQDTFLVLFGDSYLPIDNRAVHDRLLGSAAQAVLVVYDNSVEDTLVPNNIALDAESYVTRYEKKSQAPGLTRVDAGVLAMRRAVLALSESAGAFSLENELYPRLIGRRQLLAYETRQRFYDIGTPEGLKLFERVVAP